MIRETSRVVNRGPVRPQLDRSGRDMVWMRWAAEITVLRSLGWNSGRRRRPSIAGGWPCIWRRPCPACPRTPSDPRRLLSAVASQAWCLAMAQNPVHGRENCDLRNIPQPTPCWHCDAFRSAGHRESPQGYRCRSGRKARHGSGRSPIAPFHDSGNAAAGNAVWTSSSCRLHSAGV